MTVVLFAAPDRLWADYEMPLREALAALLGPNAKGLSATTITRLKADWWSEYEAWEKRDLGARRFLYIWADGVYFKPRMAEEKQCVLVIVGADEYGRKELLAMTDGFRESTQSWREVLLDLKRRGLKQDPKLAVGDGALGFWTALREVFPTTREQRCWLHKTMNVLNAMPKSVQAKAKAHLHDIWQAGTKAEANVAFDFFVEAYGVKWDKAVAKLVKDRDALLTFYDYPAEHWKHIRTSNPIESTFATVRHRTARGLKTRRAPGDGPLHRAVATLLLHPSGEEFRGHRRPLADDRGDRRDPEQAVDDPADHIPDARTNPGSVGPFVIGVDECFRHTPEKIQEKADCEDHQQRRTKGCGCDLVQRTLGTRLLFGAAEGQLEGDKANENVDDALGGVTREGEAFDRFMFLLVHGVA